MYVYTTIYKTKLIYLLIYSYDAHKTNMQKIHNFDSFEKNSFSNDSSNDERKYFLLKSFLLFPKKLVWFSLVIERKSNVLF